LGDVATFVGDDEIPTPKIGFILVCVFSLSRRLRDIV
jgi:hypothetical protein